MNPRMLAVAAIVTTMTFVQGSASQAGSGFSLRSLKGVYGFSGSGTIGGGTIPSAIVGLNYFDRAGGCRIRALLNTGTRVDASGAVAALESTSCSYSVNPDGTASLDVTFEPPFTGPFHSDFVIVDNGRELHFVLSDPVGQTLANGVSKHQGGH